jgi:phosphate:Na+ symporter
MNASAAITIVGGLGLFLLGILLLAPITAAADWVGARLDDPEGVLALAAFSSIFKFVGVLAFFPWLDRFSQFIVGISGKGAESVVSYLEPTLAEAGGPVALEAAWRAILEVARGAVDAIRRRLAGEIVPYEPPIDAVCQIEHFLQSLSLETIDLGAIEPRLVRLCHAVDHLRQLNDDLTSIPSAVGGWKAPVGFDLAARAPTGWLDATKDPGAGSNPAISEALQDASGQLSAERKAGRDKVLEEVALQRTPTATARGVLETLGWADSALHHAWRLAESLRIASGNHPANSLTREIDEQSQRADEAQRL